MTLLTKHWPPLLYIALSLFGGFVAHPYLPEQIPVHWGVDGDISSYTDKGHGIFLNPAAMIVAYLFFALIPYTDKRRVRELRELGVYEPLRNTAVYAFGFAQLLAIGIGLNIFQSDANFLVGLGCLFVVLGSELVRSDLGDRIKNSIPRACVIPRDQLVRLSKRLRIAAFIGILGVLLAPYQMLWFFVPASTVFILEFCRKPLDAE